MRRATRILLGILTILVGLWTFVVEVIGTALAGSFRPFYFREPWPDDPVVAWFRYYPYGRRFAGANLAIILVICGLMSTISTRHKRHFLTSCAWLTLAFAAGTLVMAYAGLLHKHSCWEETTAVLRDNIDGVWACLLYASIVLVGIPLVSKCMQSRGTGQYLNPTVPDAKSGDT